MNVFVIGGGASGLVAAIKASEIGCNVTILERNDKCGKKLLLTGNGRCNFYNDFQSIDKYHSNNIELFKNILDSKKDEIIKFFNDLNVVEKNINGYYYPYTNQSITILNALLYKLEELKVKIIYNEYVTDIEKQDRFIIKTNNNIYYADKVILSTGSLSYKKTGSDGIGYKILKKLGHNITDIYPSLVQINGSDNYYKKWNGVRSEVSLTLKSNNEFLKEERGEVQFTDYGISGICTFNLSGIVSRELSKNKKVTIEINFIPWFNGNKKDFINWLNNKNKNYTVSKILDGFLNYKITNLILELLNIDKNKYLKDINIDELVDKLMNFKFNVLSTKSFDFAQTCTGGVYLNEINTNTCESLKVKGLYITGELLDVDGDCGGYNLSIAWMTGLIAGENIKSIL